ncbi:hypothetical protein Dimus_004967 [Dionaea muscipula]
MENSGEGADDQGSGWFEVKKKHRSSSKFSVKNWVAGSSRRHADDKSGNFQVKHGNPLLTSTKDFPAHFAGDVSNHCSISKGSEKSYFPDKCVVNGDNECLNNPQVRAVMPNDSYRSATDDENDSKSKPGVPPKIKWCDSEVDAFQMELKDQVAPEIKFGEIGDDDLAMCRISKKVSDLASCGSLSKCLEADKDVVKVIEMVSEAQLICPSLPVCSPSKENHEKVNEMSFSCMEDAVTSKEMTDPSYDAPDDKKLLDDDIGTTDGVCVPANYPSHDKFSSVAIVEPATGGNFVQHICTSSLGHNQMSEVTRSDGHSITELNDRDLELGESVNSVSKVSRDSWITLGVEECRVLHSGLAESNINSLAKEGVLLHNDKVQDNDSRTQIINALGKGEFGESKERFRERLWCFLFENLNRAIDELYLLCELECDLEQVKESILVLEEAASDFRELNARVEEFEKLKKNSPKLVDGVMHMKSDHRRPHAVSWEVRRMTTSPLRAEILSSSLEAFKKIQQERVKIHVTDDVNNTGNERHTRKPLSLYVLDSSSTSGVADLGNKSRKQNTVSDFSQVNSSREKRFTEAGRSSKSSSVRNNRFISQSSSSSDLNIPKHLAKGSSAAIGGKTKKEQLGSSVEEDNISNLVDQLKRQNTMSDKVKEKERRSSISWKSMDAWKEKRNWEEILASPCRSSRLSHSPSMGRKNAERTRTLHDKLMLPEKKRKTALDLKKEAEEKHARAMRIRSELENERVQKLQRTSEKLNRVNEWQAVRSMKLREGLYARHQRSESRHEAYIAQVVKRAGDESSKVNEVRFITSLNEESKKFILRQKLQDSQTRRAEKLQVLKTKQKEDMAREEAVLERKKVIDAEKLQRLAETQRKKEEAQVRREEERKASSAAREAKTLEQLRRREERAKAQQEEAELLAQKLAERLSESEQRRKFYLEQIKERASMDFRDQSSPLQRRILSKEGLSRPTSTIIGDDTQVNNPPSSGGSHLPTGNVEAQQSLKRRIKRIRQRLMALKHALPESTSAENSGIGYKTAMGSAKAKIGRWLQDLQRHRQERKEGASSIGLVTSEMIKFLEGKDLELQASRQAGLLDFISSALPASHISKPEACQVTIYLLKLLRVVLSVPINRTYFLAQNLLPPAIPMLSAALESYIKIAASLNSPVISSLPSSKTPSESFDSMSEVVDGFLWTVAMIIGQETSDERQLQMQDSLLELVISYQVIHRLRDLFALYDRPQAEGSPFPSAIVLSINLLEALTSRPRAVSCIEWESLPITSLRENEHLVASIKENGDPGYSVLRDSAQEQEPPMPIQNDGSSHNDEVFGQSSKLQGIHKFIRVNENSAVAVGMERKYESFLGAKQPQELLLSTIAETGLVSLLSLLTAALLQATNRSSSEQISYNLPSNFEEVATGVLKVLNNMALMDISFTQKMLARPDLKVEFFHIMSFLLAHCTSNWKVAGDRVGFLLLESLFLVGHFSLFHLENQAVLRWGKGPTILHKICDLPFMFFSDPELMPVLGGAIVAACFGCEQNKVVVEQELSTEMLLSLVKSCRNTSPAIQSPPPTEVALKNGRANGRSLRNSSSVKAGASGNSQRISKLRNLAESRLTKSNEELNLKQKEASARSASPVMLHCRFPGSFIDRAEQFFSMELSIGDCSSNLITEAA